MAIAPGVKWRTLLAVAVAGLWAAAALAAPAAIAVHTASTHPMRYHLALPDGWTTARQWPVLVVVPDAHRDFDPNLRAFVAARGDRPYILVAPEVLTCGGARTRTADHYSYSKAVWDSLQGIDDFAFDDSGVAAVLADVRRRWHGESTAFLTGWEAGGHTVWALALRHPERWRGVAPVSPNYQRRGLAPASFSNAPERKRLPLQPLLAGAPSGEGAEAMKYIEQQTANALADARAHGFAPSPVRVIPGADHGALAPSVLAWCDSLRLR